MPLNYRRGGVTYQINLYDSDTNWENSLKLRQSGATKYAQLSTNMYHRELTHMRVREGGDTYGVLKQRDDLELFAWGYNERGNLGLGDQTSRSSPTQVGAESEWVNMTTSWEGQFHLNYPIFGGGIKSDGSLWMWGSNSEGMLGQEDRVARSSPVQVGLDTDWRLIRTGDGCTYAIKNDNSLWWWGDNAVGQRGNGTVGNNQSSPNQVGSLTDWLDIIGGGYGSMLALKTDGTLWAWGYNSMGECGFGDTTSRSSPVQIGTSTNWTAIGSGYRFSGAVNSNGELFTWGQNTNGSLGQGNITNISSPVQVGSLTNWRTISCGFRNMVSLKTDGTLWTWGYNHAGQLGQEDLISRSSPIQVGSDTDWETAKSGNYTVVTIKTDGTIWSWGTNYNGELGQNDRVLRSSPTQIGSDTDWRNVRTQRSGFTLVRKEA